MTLIIKHNFRELEKCFRISPQIKINYLILFCFLEVLLQPNDLLAGRAWQLFQKDSELTVYTRKTEECIENEFKAVIIIHQPIERVGTVLMDYPAYCKWIEGCTDVKLLKQNSDSNCEVYFAIGMPWPFYNRDIIYRIKSDATAGKEKMVVQGMAIKKAGVLIKKGHVRVLDAYFRVALEKITNGSTKVIYQSKADASFNVPDYLSRTICGRMVYNSMVNLKNLLNNGHY